MIYRLDVNYLIDIELLILNEVNDKKESINLSLNMIIARCWFLPSNDYIKRLLHLFYSFNA